MERPKRLRVVSDGTSHGTFVYDESGKMIENVKEIHWHLRAPNASTITVTVYVSEIDAKAKGTIHVLSPSRSAIELRSQLRRIKKK
jgi:hypothetical protein